MIIPLDLVEVPDDEVVGIYRVKGVAGKLPERMRWLHPQAKRNFVDLCDATPIVVSDMFRSPESSLRAIQEKRGALPPGFSGHGYGFSIDIDVDACFKKGKLSSKTALDKIMNDNGWYCHRRDARRGFEDWHYDCDIDGHLLGNIRRGNKTLAPARERMIEHFYGTAWNLSNKLAQTCLIDLGLYGGAVDGLVGPLTRQALLAFQRTWQLKESSALDETTKRVLWFVTACRGPSQAR